MSIKTEQRAELKALAAKMLDCVPRLQKHNDDWIQHAAACCGLGAEGIRAMLAALDEAERKSAAQLEQARREEREACAALIKGIRLGLGEASMRASIIYDTCEQIENAILASNEKGKSNG